MEVNLPDKGLFKTMGKNEKILNLTKKNFPLIRNKHQFQYTHNHGDTYQSTTNYFHKQKFMAFSQTNRFNQHMDNVRKQSNKSQIVFGSDRNDYKSLNKVDFAKYDNFKRSKPIYHKEEGFQLGNEPINTVFKTFNQEVFSPGRSHSTNQTATYKNWRGAQRFNPITGQSKPIQSTFGFEDFKYNGDKQRRYKANNFTRIPKMNERYDIISGRKLTYQ